jgi:hypothetical protein
MSGQTFTELVRVVAQLPRIEFIRRRRSLHVAVAYARRLATRKPSRSLSDRAVLSQVIAAVDRRMPGGANCVRRSLLEMSLDNRAAQERLHAGFVRGGGTGSGHAWLGSVSGPRTYDAIVSL